MVRTRKKTVKGYERTITVYPWPAHRLLDMHADGRSSVATIRYRPSLLYYTISTTTMMTFLVAGLISPPMRPSHSCMGAILACYTLLIAALQYAVVTELKFVAHIWTG